MGRVGAERLVTLLGDLLPRLAWPPMLFLDRASASRSGRA